ncbi:MAG: FMN-binding glutamate synthase family protein [Acidimicrobiales bacterium]|nr:FMN-binding glutamate synthase family protein [Acidimicrobiales bacterium]
MIERVGKGALWASMVLVVVAAVLAVVIHPRWLWAEVVLVPAVVVGVWDLAQTRHSILRNFPVIGHFRFLLEGVGPELHQYLVESDTDGRPFDRDTRSLIYQRAKSVPDKKPFGTEIDVYAAGYTWLAHSIAPRPVPDDPVAALRVVVGGEQCDQPYSLSVLNISAMSFGALGGHAVRAMNKGAKEGHFAHDTGEGGISRYHREHGGDLIWQIGTGYFGCRAPDGTFDPDLFARTATDPQVKMIEIKVSQGAKPGHGGILPAAKVTDEIAEARHVPAGRDVFSPTYHQAFSTPDEMIDFVVTLRELSEGKPVGFKICIGDPREFIAIAKAMLERDTYPDFVVVDGGEGGTGAAPLEFSDHLGMPLVEGLMLVQNVLIGAGIRDRLRVGASGKMVTASAIAQSMALGADWCNSARAFMMAVGCIQAQQCHTNECPVGVATQEPTRYRALHVGDKSQRVYHFHHNTMESLSELVAAIGLDRPDQLRPHHVLKRIGPNRVAAYEDAYVFLNEGALLEGRSGHAVFDDHWAFASADTFARVS